MWNRQGHEIAAGSVDDPGDLDRVNRRYWVHYGTGAPRADLHEDEYTPMNGDYVGLSKAAPVVALDDAVAFEKETDGSNVLSHPTFAEVFCLSSEHGGGECKREARVNVERLSVVLSPAALAKEEDRRAKSDACVERTCVKRCGRSDQVLRPYSRTHSPTHVVHSQYSFTPANDLRCIGLGPCSAMASRCSRVP